MQTTQTCFASELVRLCHEATDHTCVLRCPLLPAAETRAFAAGRALSCWSLADVVRPWGVRAQKGCWTPALHVQAMWSEVHRRMIGWKRPLRSSSLRSSKFMLLGCPLLWWHWGGDRNGA